jgi:hypothetical protein
VTVPGFAAFKDTLSYFSFSGSVLPEIAGDLSAGREVVALDADDPLPDALVEKMTAMRRRQ